MSAIHALRRLEARDFKRHKQLEVIFSDSMTTIRGPNYTGKSSLLEALRFAFGGSSFVPGGRAIIVRTGAKDCNVDLEFKAANGVYHLWRSLKDAKLFRIVEDDPEQHLIASGHTAVNAAVESIIGMPLKDWLVLSYSEQGEAAALMTLGASKLNQMIEQLSNVDFITKVSERAKTVADKSSVAVKTFPEYLKDFDADTAAISLAEMALSLDTAVRKRQDEENRLTDAQRAHEAITTQIGIARQAEKHRQELSQQCVAIEARLKQTEESLAKERLALSVHDRVKDSLSLIPHMRDEATAQKAKATEGILANNQLVILKNTIQAKETWLNGAGLDLLTKYREAVGPLADLTTEVNALQIEYAGDQSTLAAMKQDWDKAEESVKAGVCRTCKRPMESGNHEHALEEAARLKKEYEDAVLVVDDLHGRLIKAKGNLAAILQRMPSADIQSIYPQRERELVESKKALEAIVAKTVDPEQIKAWETEAATLNTRAADLAKIKWEIEHRNTAIAAYEQTLIADRKLWVNAQDRLSEIKLIDTTELEDKRAQLAQVVNDLTTEVYTVRHAITDLEHKQSVLRARKEEFEQINASNAEHAARAASFSGLRKYLSDNKAAFMGELWDQLMALTSEFANQVTEGDITAVGRTEDGEFWMEEFGVRKPMIAASGGQKSICGVGLRMALPSLISGGSRLILLDEPSAALTEEMSSSLAGALKAQDRQIVLVTHRSGEEYLSDVVVTLER